MLAILKSGLAVAMMNIVTAPVAIEPISRSNVEAGSRIQDGRSVVSIRFDQQESSREHAQRSAGQSVARYATGVKQELIRAAARSMTDRSARRAWHTM